mmetsp:Transcript_650/g.1486  ORF Transcript_650/g.1486 Transcript_650/m.1486 type:complete len:376 (-) Transcript_650:840-1967(-)|eukprot:CAMPEP_0116100432 /NCGR_PEP_ID=MMETSP0327-20121206/12287_1 /TAXON_ID=44447 /ORGANISM="Pseudo-nitzschia delicatissima, Strain B596" /LENGTH=375 /DNA_ID=CAMNT_0003592353 /DNA_START=1 /DNA_END=1128 /DNA_ORIENTATION=+
MIKGSMAKWFLFKTAITATASHASSAFVSRAASSVAIAAATEKHIHPSPSATSVRNHSTGSRKSSLFESMRTGYYRNTNSDEISLDKLLEKAASVRSTVSSKAIGNLNDGDKLFFSSSYDASGSKHDEDMTTRGFSNWIVPGKIMVGQYPGRVPETNTPTEEEVREHLRKVLFQNSAENTKQRNVCFVSLQSELPPQDDYESWNKRNGEIYLDPLSREEWPNPFSHYAPTVESVLKEHEKGENIHVRYIHHPIQDLSVPSNSKNLKLLLWKVLDFLDGGETTESMVYIHCWGGRGRAGLTACCLLTLLEFAKADRNTMDVSTIFDVVQTGYESRLGSENMPLALSRSPQTESQRTFVRQFYQEVQEEANTRAARD